MANTNPTALYDILLLLSLFTGRDVFALNDCEEEKVLLADPRVYGWGGILRCSLDVNFNVGLNFVYELIRKDWWQKEYHKGYFLFLAKSAFHRQTLDSAFIQCWTIWEHLFATLNRKWLLDKQVQHISSPEKIAFLLYEYVLQDQIDSKIRNRISALATIRNKLIHYGRFPDYGEVHDDAELFIDLTEHIIAKILGLTPPSDFSTAEKLGSFISRTR